MPSNNNPQTFSRILTAELKKLILKSDLIDTGVMYMSMEVHTHVKQKLEINIKTTQYYKYLDVKYSLTLDLVNSDAMKTFFREDYNKYVDRYIDKILRGGVKDVDPMNVMSVSLMPTITINGKPIYDGGYNATINNIISSIRYN